uniref:RHD domain-containing protein n=1 Tax=Chelonoidis abingdonii TaxID=106734 RepID=A0A8C0IWC4_CHEAB
MCKPLTLQMFIGTADERNLRPHAFYQVHRITGKMVATASYETIISSTKVLEMSLLPENNMAANIDCAGILKLRNSDIELRKGETDIGRKNTRVRLVFRVHVPQGNGKVVSIQAASVPIECSQRSAQELPQVETCSLSAGSGHGGEEMVLSGANFLPDSKVVFIERGPGKCEPPDYITPVLHLPPGAIFRQGKNIQPGGGGYSYPLCVSPPPSTQQWERGADVANGGEEEGVRAIRFCRVQETSPPQG